MSPIQQMIADKLTGGGAPPAATPADAPPPDAGDPVLDAAGQLVDAVKAGDPQAVADALRTAFKALEMEPHMEGDEGAEQGA